MPETIDFTVQDQASAASTVTRSSHRAENTKFLRAARGAWFDVPPIWLMRQAGRYLAEYRAIREQHDFITVCRSPELACEVTLQPIRRFGFDAAILFSDILIPAIPLGTGLVFDKGHGPHIERPVRNLADVKKLREFDPREELADVLAAVRLIRQELPEETALIGFAGAPFTMACYLIEGGKPDPFVHVKQLMYNDPQAFALLMQKVGEMTAHYLRAMVEAGADAVQLFDTWAGILTEAEYRAVNLPVIQAINRELADLDVPRIYFALNGMHLLNSIAETGCTVMGLDWRANLRSVTQEYSRFAFQGNLDPVLLLSGESTIREQTRRIIREARDSGFIFNLGHGILPSTPVSAVEILLDELRGGAR